jgi:hypothetical protein
VRPDRNDPGPLLDGPSPVTEVSTQGFAPLLARLNDLPSLTRLGKRTIERLRAAGKLPRPDLRIGRTPLWKLETIREWINTLARDGGTHEAHRSVRATPGCSAPCQRAGDSTGRWPAAPSR